MTDIPGTQILSSSGDPISSNLLDALKAGANITIVEVTVAGGDKKVEIASPGMVGNHDLLNASEHPDTVAAAVVRGDLVIGNGTPEWDRLAIGGATTFLKSDGTDPAWTSIVAGDITADTFDDARISLSSVTQHINDAGTDTSDIWSASKITAEILVAKNDFDFKDSVKAGTDAALPTNTRAGNVLTATVNAVFPTLDGVTINTDGTAGAADGTEAGSDHIVVKNEATGANNGIYFLSDPGDGANPWKLTRRSDADSDSEVTAGLYVFADQGTVNANTAWVITTNDPITVNTTALVFGKYSGLGQITAGAGLTKTGDTLDVIGTADRITINANDIDIASTYVGQTSITTLGTIATGTWEGTTVAVDQGGTGQTTYTNGQLLIGNTTGNTLTKATLTAGSTKLSIVNGTGTITLDVAEANIDHDNLSGFVANEHLDWAAASVGTIDATNLPATVILNDQNNSLGAFYLDIDDIAVPANPGVGVRRLFVDTATSELSVRTNGGVTVSLETEGLVTKSGTQGTFSGNPKKATVTFSGAFADANYSVSIIGQDGDDRTWEAESLAAGSFVINSNSNSAPSNDALWIAIKHGES